MNDQTSKLLTQEAREFFRSSNQAFTLYYLHYAQQNRSNKSILLDELANILSAAHLSLNDNNWNLVLEFTRILNNFLVNQALKDEYLSLNQPLIENDIIRDAREIADIYWQMGELEETGSNYSEARRFFRQQLLTYEQNGMKEEDICIPVLLRLGELAVSQGDLEEAVDVTNIRLRIAQKGGKLKDQVVILLGLSRLYCLLQDYSQAEDLCEQGIQIAQRIGYRAGIIDLLVQSSDIFRYQGNLIEATSQLLVAQKMAKDIGDKPREKDIQSLLREIEQTRKKEIFISYNHQDRKFVERLANDLRARGFSVWWDEWEIKVGDSIITKINEGIKQSAYLAVALSPHSIKSDWVQSELNAALMRQLSDRNITVLPLLLTEVNPDELPPLLRERKWADFRKEYDHGLSELLRALERVHSELDTGSPKQSLNIKQKTLTILRDPVWQFVGALVAIIGLIITLWTIFQPGIPTKTPTPLISPTLSVPGNTIIPQTEQPSGLATIPVGLSSTITLTATPVITPETTAEAASFELPKINTVVEGDLPSYGKQHGVVRDLNGKLYVFYATDNARKLWVISSIDNGETWSDAAYLGEADEGQEASAVVDNAGNIHLVWGAWKAGMLYYSLFTKGVWNDPVDLLQGTFARDIAIDSANHPHIVISAADTYHIYQKDGEWVADMAVEGAWHPDVVVDQQDDVHIVFNDGNFYPTSWVRTYHQAYDGRSWSTKEKLSKGPNWSGGASMTIDNDGNFHVVWLSPRTEGGGDDVIYYARYIGGEWQEPIPIGDIVTSAGSTGKESPAIASDENGIVYVVWRGINQKGKAVIFLRALLSDGWTPRIELGDPDASDVWWPSVAYQQGLGKGIDIVWSAVIGTKRVVRYTHVEFIPK